MKDAYIQNKKFHSFKPGSKESFDFLYRQYNESIYLFAYQLTRNREAAEEVTAEAFTKVWERWKQLQDFSGIKTYLYNTTRNVFIDMRRRSEAYGRRQAAYLLYSTEQEETTILHAMIRTEFMQEVYAAIDKLPEQCARVIKMIFVEGRSFDEIATNLNLSIHTVYDHKYRGLSMLRKLLRLSVFIIFFCTGS